VREEGNKRGYLYYFFAFSIISMKNITWEDLEELDKKIAEARLELFGLCLIAWLWREISQ
jgi:hypothetical protein